MMDLREFLKVLEEEHELQKIKAEVDPKHELGAICKIHNEKPNSPALLFENVKGHTIPVVGQLLASDRRVALALGLSQENVFDETVRRANKPIPTRLVPKRAMPRSGSRRKRCRPDANCRSAPTTRATADHILPPGMSSSEIPSSAIIWRFTG